jgi:hypothetical protein
MTEFSARLTQKIKQETRPFSWGTSNMGIATSSKFCKIYEKKLIFNGKRKRNLVVLKLKPYISYNNKAKKLKSIILHR